MLYRNRLMLSDFSYTKFFLSAKLFCDGFPDNILKPLFIYGFSDMLPLYQLMIAISN